MILLDGQSLRIRDRFPVESMPLNLEERNSTATITVGPEAPEIKVGDWLEIQGHLKTVPLEQGGKTLVMYANRMARYNKPAEEFVTFS
jgi:hypothetical protein